MYVLMESAHCGVGCLMCRAVFAGYSRLSVLPIFSICLRISGMKGAGQLTARPAQHPGFYHIWDKLCNITTHNMHTSKLNLENPLEVGSFTITEMAPTWTFSWLNHEIGSPTQRSYGMGSFKNLPT